MKIIVTNFGCGTYKGSRNRELGQFVVTRFSEISEKIIPFFLKYPLRGTKLLNFKDFCKVAELMRNKAHLTEQGLDQISQIKVGMTQEENN
jgi:hypothetical protein